MQVKSPGYLAFDRLPAARFETAGTVKILHVVGNSKFGGASRIVAQLAQMAQRQNWKAAILASDPIYGQFIRGCGLELVPLDVAHRAIVPWRDLRDVWRLHRYLRAQPFTVVHTHTAKGGFLGRLAARLAGVPIIIHTAHGFSIHEKSPWYETAAYAALERLASYWCTVIVCVSEFHRDWAIRLHMADRKRLAAIPNGVAPERVLPTIDRDELRSTLGAVKGDFVIVAPGRLAKQKGLETLLEAAAILARETSLRFRVWIAGAGPLRVPLETAAIQPELEGRIQFLGFREDVGNLLAAADLVVLPSEREGLSVALLESIAAGRPIVMANIGSNREVAARGNFAMLFPPGDAKALATAVLSCSEDGLGREHMGREARKIFEAHYTEERMLNGYRSLYARLLSEAGVQHENRREAEVGA